MKTFFNDRQPDTSKFKIIRVRITLPCHNNITNKYQTPQSTSTDDVSSYTLLAHLFRWITKNYAELQTMLDKDEMSADMFE